MACVLPAVCDALRFEHLGYNNKSQSNLGITFNDLHEYVVGLKRAIKTPSGGTRGLVCGKDGGAATD